jgi:imidazolonepropionase-like amidohydrolase
VNIRAVLRSPLGETVVRDVVDGLWSEPTSGPSDAVGEGMWALPGLVDAHAHLAAVELDYGRGDLEGGMERARRSLAAGVTLLLDKGWSDDAAVGVIGSLPPGERPEIEAAARVIAAEGGHFPDFALEIDMADLESTVHDEAISGAGWVKLIGDWPRRGVGPVANFTESELRTAVRVAESVGAKVAIHTMARDVPTAAVAAGVHSIEHGLFLTEDDLAALGRRSGMWVPTVLRSEATMIQLGPDSSGGRLFAEGLEQLKRLLPLGVEAGVRVLAGTDLIGFPADVSAEALRLGEYGLSNRQVVEAVSTAGFVATGRDETFAPGTPADAVFFAVNPVEQIGALAHPARVMRLGRLL